VSSAARRRPRRRDPARRDRIIDVTLDVIADHGVAGTTHRLIAAAADVPLGSLTYYFTGIDDILEQAFGRHATRMATRDRLSFEGVRNRAQLLRAVTDLAHGTDGSSGRDSIITFELYLSALRNPALRAITAERMTTSGRLLRQHLDETTARGVHALYEGLILQVMLSGQPAARAQTVDLVGRVLGPGRRGPAAARASDPG
jgi:DNA-binding transcriptional regulator YbjK